MRQIATIDCETDPFLFDRIPTPFIWGFYDGENYKRFLSTNAFIEHIKNFEGIIYAHNGGKFDYHFLLDALEPNQELMIINGRLVKFKIGKAEMRDSWNILPVPLAAYKKDDFDYQKLEKDVRDKHMPEIEKYLKADCVYLHEIISRQIDEYGLNLTLAGAAFKYWREKFSGLSHTPKSPKQYFKHFQPFYYGGRVECFQKGTFEHEFKSYDINSAYPYAMLHEHPFGYSFTTSKKLPDNEKDLQLSFVHLHAISKGALPHRTKSGLSFPNDGQAREYMVTGWEILEALKNNKIEIIKIERVHTFLDSINFTDYVNHFYGQKNKLKGKDAAGYLLAKLFLNSLYGKFGQSGEKHMLYTTCEPWNAPDELELGKSFCGELGSLALMGEPVPEEKQNYYNVATAASITGFVRAYMFRHLCKADGLMYCDTDSITAKNLNCDIGTELGQWEHEGTYTKGAIAGKKMYAYKYADKKGEYKISSKGVKLSEKEIFSVAKGKEVLYKNNAPSFSASKKPHFITRRVRMT